MPRDRSADLLNDILAFIDRIEAGHRQIPQQKPAWTRKPSMRCFTHCNTSAKRCPPLEVTNLAPQVPWQKIKAMRNLIAHDYAGIEAAVVWQTVEHRLPELRIAVEGILKRLS
jgi:uncharacterized protein with HEPN domain